jgi:hypothetical protein
MHVTTFGVTAGPIWAIGSAVVGNACFTCITGEADPSSDYEIDEVLKGGGGETLVAQAFVDDQSSKVFRSRRGRKTTKPNPKMQGDRYSGAPPRA